MENLFSNINLNVPKSVASSLDLKLLDATCNHQILNEQVVFSSGLRFGGAIYNATDFYNNGIFYSSAISPDESFIFVTELPMGNSNIQIFESPVQSSPMEETIIVPSDLTQRFQFSFPPVPNTTTAQLVTTEVDYDGENETIYFPFSNYTLSQLFGIITFNQASDIGSTILFKYTADIKQIFTRSKDASINWEFLGYNQKGQGVFRIYGRAFTASQSSLIIRYFSSPTTCPRCAGSNLTNDLDYNDSTSRFYNVYDFSKLIQDFFKRFLTRKGSNPFDGTDGTQIPSYIGVGKNNPVLIDTLIRTEAINLIDAIRLKQNSQIVIQGISLAEQIQQINQLVVTRINMTDINLVIELQSRSQATAQVKTQISSN